MAALQWMAGRFERRTGVTCVLRTPPPGLPALQHLPTGVPLVAYRVAQEALTNITKHAHASRVEIDLALAGGVLSLEVSDNGRGLSQEDLAKARSFGIRGLHERARTVDGWVDLSSGSHVVRPAAAYAAPDGRIILRVQAPQAAGSLTFTNIDQSLQIGATGGVK